MKIPNRLSALCIGAALFCVPALSLGQQPATTPAPAPSQDTGAKQDVKNAGTATKTAAKDVGHGVATGTKKVYHKTKTGTKKVVHKTATTTKGAVDGAKDGAKQPDTTQPAPAQPQPK
jgi:hypothetical protein